MKSTSTFFLDGESRARDRTEQLRAVPPGERAAGGGGAAGRYPAGHGRRGFA